MRKQPRRDVAQEITDLILSKIEQGVLPWRRPWRRTGDEGPPLRVNGVRYSGINSLYLWLVADMRGYPSRYWMTYRQAQELGGQVRKGEKSSPSIYFNSVEKTETDETSGEEQTKSVRFMRAYSVFNASQIDGLPEHFYPRKLPAAEISPSEKQAQIDAFFDPIPIEVRHGGNQAFYSPAGDFVQLPHLHAFESADLYAATRGHELGHATGAPHRLARTFGKRFGDKAYAFEELVAELTSARICYELRLPCELHDSHASYIDHWASILASDKSAIITAAAKADQAFNFLAAFSGYDEQTGEGADERVALPADA
jgi:antirestriction protein ArdC